MNGLYQNLSKNIKNFAHLFNTKIHGLLFGRLSTRLLFTLTMLSALPLIVVGLFMRSVTQESISDYINNQNTLIARRAGNEIRLFLDTPDRLL